MVALSLFIHATEWCPEKWITVQLHVLYCLLCISARPWHIEKKKKDTSKPDLLQNESLLFGKGQCQSSDMAKGPDYSSLFTCSLVLHPANEPHGVLHILQHSEEGSCGSGAIHSHSFTLLTTAPKLSPMLWYLFSEILFADSCGCVTLLTSVGLCQFMPAEDGDGSV